MKVTPDIIRHEFIGATAFVAKSPHADYLGIYGKVVGETKNTFSIESQGRTKSILKPLAVIDFTLNDGTVVEIDGKLLVGRPEDRIKKTIKRLW